MKNKNIAIIIAVAVVLLLIIYLLSMPNYEVVSPAPTPVASKTKTVTTTAKKTTSPTPTVVQGSVNLAPSTSIKTVHNIQIKNYSYDTKVLNVRTGDVVVWRNQDSMLHTVSGDGGLESGPMGLAQSYSFTFNTPGTYNYHCKYHPNMTATIVVTP